MVLKGFIKGTSCLRDTLQTLPSMQLHQAEGLGQQLPAGAKSSLVHQEANASRHNDADFGRTTCRTKAIQRSSSSAGESWLSAREISGVTQKIGSGLSLSYLLDDKAKLDRSKCNQSLSLQDKTQDIFSPPRLILFFCFSMRMQPKHLDFFQRKERGKSVWRWRGRREPAINVQHSTAVLHKMEPSSNQLSVRPVSQKKQLDLATLVLL